MRRSKQEDVIEWKQGQTVTFALQSFPPSEIILLLHYNSKQFDADFLLILDFQNIFKNICFEFVLVNAQSMHI